jgi:hypothetical protein
MIRGSGKTDYTELKQIISSVRNRWRLRVALRGLAVVLAGSLVAFLFFTFVMDQFRYSPPTILIVRILAVLALISLTVRYLVLPLMKRISDEQIALYIEEYDPSLKTALLSAVEFSSKADSIEYSDGSPDLVRSLIRSVVKKCYLAAYDVSVGRQALNRAAAWFMIVTSLSALMVILSPPFIRYGARAIVMWGEEEAVNPYSISVSPGDTTLSKGADQQISAHLVGFNSDRAVISIRENEGSDWQRWPMVADGATDDYLFIMFDLSGDLEYFVESSGVRSDTYTIGVKERPFVDYLELEYRFPAYTGLAPQVIRNSGDIAAPPGTEVDFRIISTMSVSGGYIRIEGMEPVTLTVESDTTLSGSLTVREQGVYRIDLIDIQGTAYIASPDYLIDVLADRPPTVWFDEPGRDIQVTSIEEVHVDVGAEDDYGVSSLEIVYSVNGGTENVIELMSPSGEPMLEISAGHTFFLEEYSLEAGDIISYYARVADGNSISGPQNASSDIYFMDIRPFGRDYRESQQQGGAPQGGSGQQNSATGLSRQQRDIIAATFNLIRDRESYTSAEYNENLATLALLQGQLARQVGNFIERMARGSGRVGGTGSELEQILDAMEQARTEMVAAEGRLGERDPDGAMPPEQRALRNLQRAEAVISDVQVSQGQQQSGGGGFAGGGGQQSQAENLADLLDLELDRARNQYETVRRGQQQQTDEEVDEALEKLRELAQRQQQEIDRQRRLAATSQNMSGGMGNSQRQLAEIAEELARQLERLARENSRNDLMESARRLQEAAEEMRRSASRSGNPASERGLEALAQLEEARRLLERDQQNRLQRDIDDAMRRAEDIAESEEVIQRVVENMPEIPSERAEDVSRLMERKDEMSQELDELERDLDRMAAYSRTEDREASRELAETANSMRTNRLQDKVRFSKGVIQQRSTEYAEFFEEQISSDIDEKLQGPPAGRKAISLKKCSKELRIL